MEFKDVVGSRRSIRWFDPDRPVATESIQRILEAARLTGSPGNIQPWRAVVVVQRDLDPNDRDALLDAANRQRAHEQAPVWIYWFADIAAAAGERFLEQVQLALEIGALATSAGWDAEAARASIEDGTPSPRGMPPLHQTIHVLSPEIAAVLACQETIGAITTAALAAVDEGLGTCLHTATAPPEAPVLYDRLALPSTFVPVWVQLLGYPAETREAGGARPRHSFESLFALGRWGAAFPRDESVVAELASQRLVQPDAPLPGRADELAQLGRRFGYVGEGRGDDVS
jgi:nitroreductase